MNVKTIYGALLMTIMRIAGKDAAKKFDVLFRFRKHIDLKHPKTLRDKVIYIENHCPEKLSPECTDKWAVRRYVAQKGFEHILVPVYGDAYDNVDDIPFDTYPQKYVLKAAHGCKMNYFCTDKKTFDVDRCKKVLKTWLATTYGTYSGEWHYFDIPHRIYCEHYLDDAEKMIDYKFHCMNGVPQFVLVCGERQVSETGNRITRQIFDMDWNPIEGLTNRSGSEAKKPEHLSEMIDIAKKLSEDFKFVRVDLYEIEGKIYFGELTFTPTNGVFSHYTDSFLTDMGNKLTL